MQYPTLQFARTAMLGTTPRAGLTLKMSIDVQPSLVEFISDAAICHQSRAADAVSETPDFRVLYISGKTPLAMKAGTIEFLTPFGHQDLVMRFDWTALNSP